MLVIMGWGTGDTERLRPRIASDEVPFMSAACSEELTDTVPFTFIDEDAPGLAEIQSFNRAQGIDPATRNVRYVQGWVTMRVMAEGIRLAGDDLTGEGIRQGLESLTDFDTGGLMDDGIWQRR